MLRQSSIKTLYTAIFIAAGLVGMIHPGLQAKESKSASRATVEIDRFGIGLNGGFNLDRPFLGAELSYRPAAFDDQLRIFAQYDFLHATSNGSFLQRAWLGLRHEFYRDPKLLNMRAYGLLMVGLSFGYDRIGNQNLPAMIPGVALGCGAEFQMAGPLWGFAEISSGFPVPIRPEIGLRLAF